MTSSKELFTTEKNARDEDKKYIPALLTEQKKKAPKATRAKAPWEAQKLFTVNDWVGLSPTLKHVRHDIKTSEVGGWKDLDQWKEMYLLNVEGTELLTDDQKPIVGSWYTPDVAEKILEKCRDEQRKGVKIGNDVRNWAERREMKNYFRLWLQSAAKTSKRLRAQLEDELVYGVLEDVVYNCVTKSWEPKPGCFSHSKLWPKDMQGPHKTNISARKRLLPYFGATHVKDIEALLILHGYAAIGVLQEWDFEKWGYPTVVSSTFLVRRLMDGKVKLRLVIDYRYANGVVHTVECDLPTIAEFVTGMQEGGLISKQDMKGGYHQYLLDSSNYHLACIWLPDLDDPKKGRIMYFYVCSFGWRDVPGSFQAHTSNAATTAAGKVNETYSRAISKAPVYVDDFLQRWRCGVLAETAMIAHDVFIKEVNAFNIVLAKKKCCKPSTSCEILGFQVDTVDMQLKVPVIKEKHVMSMIEHFLNDENQIDTLFTARLSGRLMSMAPAMPLVKIMLRPLYRMISSALCSNPDQPLEGLDREKDAESTYCWEVKEVTKTQAATEAMQFLYENFKRINGANLRTLLPTIVIFSDASNRGGGISLWKVVEGKLVLSMRKALLFDKSERRFESSTAREAYIMRKTVEGDIPDELLLGQVVEYVGDNKGLVYRTAIGSNNEQVNEHLIAMARGILRLNMTLKGCWWARRVYLQDEDDGSKEFELELHIDHEWFTKKISSKDPAPNIDLFACASDLIPELKKAVVMRAPTKEQEEKANGVEFYYDGFRHELQKEDIPWVFPPLDFEKKALKRWTQSKSRAAYFCIQVKDDGSPSTLSKFFEKSPFFKLQIKGAQIVKSEGTIGMWNHDVFLLKKR